MVLVTELGKVSTETLWVPHVLVKGFGMKCFVRIVWLERSVEDHPVQLMYVHAMQRENAFSLMSTDSA